MGELDGLHECDAVGDFDGLNVGDWVDKKRESREGFVSSGNIVKRQSMINSYT